MSDFNLDELKRLSAAAKSGPWETRGEDTSIPQRIYHNLGGDLEETVAHGMEWDGSHRLIAYLGTHRDRIIAMLAAADALAEHGDAVADIIPELSSCPDQYIALDEWRNALDTYRAAKGGAK